MPDEMSNPFAGKHLPDANSNSPNPEPLSAKSPAMQAIARKKRARAKLAAITDGRSLEIENALEDESLWSFAQWLTETDQGPEGKVALDVALKYVKETYGEWSPKTAQNILGGL